MDPKRFRRITTKWVTRLRSQPVTPSVRLRITEEIRQLQMGGVFIETRMPLPEGAIVKFEFQVPGRKDAYVAEGLVKWSNDGRYAGKPLGMGIEFLSIVTKGMEIGGGHAVEEAIHELTAGAEVQALLAFYASKPAETLARQAVAQALGLSPDALAVPLGILAKHGLAEIQGENVAFRPCPDESLAHSIHAWAAQRASSGPPAA